ncbi:MAG: glycosyltransferase family 4 protein [Dehalococcoidales bacterium]
MNIVLVTGGWVRIPPKEGGGAEAFVLNLAKQFSSMGHTVSLIDRKYDIDDFKEELIEGIKVVRLESPRFERFNFTLNFVLTQICFGYKINKYLKKIDNVEVVHVYVSILGLVIALLNKPIREKLFYTSVGLRHNRPIPSIVDRFAFFIENQLIKRAKKTTIANEIIAEKLVKQAKVKPNRVQIVPIGVDTTQYNPNHNTTEITKKYRLENSNIVLFVGRICADKGVEYLIKAADIVINHHHKNDVLFLIVGPSEQFDANNIKAGSYTEKVNQLVADYSLQQNIIFTGIVPIDDKIKLYTACDMVVIPSVVDLDPQVQIEAMASGKPVIGTNVGTMPRRITDGQSGFIVEPADEKQLAEKITYLLDNPDEREKMGIRARKTVEENYSAEQMALRMLEVFNS